MAGIVRGGDGERRGWDAGMCTVIDCMVNG